MDQRFREEGVDQLLRAHQIDALIISHEHFDHFWGIESVLTHCPDITLYVPEGFRSSGRTFIAQRGHTGRIITVSTVIAPSPLPRSVVREFSSGDAATSAG